MHLVQLPDVLPASVDVYRLDVDLDAHPGEVSHLLLPNECAHAERFHHQADRARFMQTRAAVRELLARRLECAPEKVEFSFGPCGKPFIVDLGKDVPSFNISHSGSHAFIAFAPMTAVTSLGVDVEKCRADVDVLAILDVAFTVRERSEVRSASNQLEALYLRWVGKEAVLKAVGVGIAEHLQCIEICPQENGKLEVFSSIPAWVRYEAMSLPAPEGYIAALAWLNKE